MQVGGDFSLVHVYVNKKFLKKNFKNNCPNIRKCQLFSLPLWKLKTNSQKDNVTFPYRR